MKPKWQTDCDIYSGICFPSFSLFLPFFLRAYIAARWTFSERFSRSSWPVSIDAENGEGRRARDCFKPDPLHLACQFSSLSPPSPDEIALLRGRRHGRTRRSLSRKVPRVPLNPPCIRGNYPGLPNERVQLFRIITSLSERPRRRCIVTRTNEVSLCGLSKLIVSTGTREDHNYRTVNIFPTFVDGRTAWESKREKIAVSA